jgi:diaminopimelate decarboxylase
MSPGTIAANREVRPPGPALSAAAARFGTPLYVTDMVDVAAAAARMEAAFGPRWHRLYSLKANDLPAITTFLHDRGWGASVVSAGEWRHARAAGVANESVAFEGLGKTDAQLELVVRETAAGRPLRWLGIESGQEAAVLARLARAAGLGRGGRPPLDVLLRLNPEVEPETRPEFAVGARASKFGMSYREILALARSGALAGPGLRLRGIHVHVGSDLGDVRAFCRAGVGAVRLLADLRAERQAGRQAERRSGPGADPRAEADRDGDLAWLDTVDFGGGFPLPDEKAPAPEEFREALVLALHEAGLELPPRPAIEPGRYLVGAAGWLVSSVLHARPGSRPAQQVVLDAGMTEFIRPALYGSRHAAHALGPDGGPRRAGPGDRAGAGLLDTALEGPVCESTDSFGRHLLPPLRRGDLVAIGQTGAYGASFTSRYNGRPAPGEVLLWPDGSLQQCERPTGSPPATKESLP